MAMSTIDYSNVDLRLFNLLQQIDGLENLVAQLGVAGSNTLITQLDTFKNAVGLEIEKQGQRP